MATTEQIQNLRRRLQDFYDKDGAQLVAADQAFSDDELNHLIDDGFTEASDGARSALNGTGADGPMAMIIARADGLLQLAQDESRRVKWSINNKTVDDTEASKRLIEIARELRMRYKDHRARGLQRELSDKVNRPTGSILRLNDTTAYHNDRQFVNRDTRRNTPRR
jgi:hypothetical protein